MQQPELISGLEAVADRYDAIFCDVWGVLHDGRKAFAAAGAALQAFRRERGPVVLITNAPVPKERVTRLFGPLGVPMDGFDEVVTSGDATRFELEKFAPGPVYPIGLGDDRSVYQGLDLTFTSDPASATVVCCTSLRNFPDGLPDDHRGELEDLISRRLPMICANPDVQFRYGDRLVWAAGALALIYEELGGTVIRPGKPDAPIYELAMRHAERLAGRALDAGRILAIGDGPATDLLGAERRGYDGLFVLNGIHGHKIAGADDPVALAQAELTEARTVARYVMEELAW